MLASYLKLLRDTCLKLMRLYLAFKPDTAASTENAFAAVELCVRDIRAWMLCDKLKINDGKTDFILIGTRQQLLKVHVNSLAIGDVRVSSVTSVKSLGAWMDSNLNFKSILTIHVKLRTTI
jgi:hypothetical protein